jgi:hypothetical protein
MAMRDLWRWWRLRPGQLGAVVILAALLAWMSVGLWQAERHYRAVLSEVRESFRKQDRMRQMQLAQLFTALDEHVSRDSKELTTRREEQQRLIELLSRQLSQNQSAAR